MELIATLVNSTKLAKKIFQDIPKDTIILFPESVMLTDKYVRGISKEHKLFVSYSHNTAENGKRILKKEKGAVFISRTRS